MGKLLFVVQCEEDPTSITQEADIQMALIGAMKALDMPFTLIPPDVANPGLAVETQPSADGAISFRDIPAFTSGGSYAVDYPLRDLVSWVQKEVEKSGLILCPDFQRGHVWTEKQQEDYITFLLRGGKTGRDLYFNCPSWNHPVGIGAYNDYVCVDGLQRLTAITRFVNNELRVFGRLYGEFKILFVPAQNGENDECQSQISDEGIRRAYMLHATFLAANQAWAITAPGGELVSIGPAGQTLFESREELLGALRQCGLTLKGNLVEITAKE